MLLEYFTSVLKNFLFNFFISSVSFITSQKAGDIEGSDKQKITPVVVLTADQQLQCSQLCIYPKCRSATLLLQLDLENHS